MTSNSVRAAILSRAVHAAVDGDLRAIEESCTDDVRAWTPGLSTTSRRELLDELARRGKPFSDIELEVVPLDIGGEFACVEWSITMTHSGQLDLGDGATIEPKGLRVTANGVTVAEFHGDRICALRQYWDELGVYEQLGLLG
jgi:hypothetical protein